MGYKRFQSTVGNQRNVNLKILMGELNAKMGPDGTSNGDMMGKHRTG